MTDDITRQRFWSWNNAKPDPTRRAPGVPRSRTRGRAFLSALEPTHALMVRTRGSRGWLLVEDCDRLVQGSEAFCLAEVATRARHWPDSEFRALPLPEAKRELRRKTWSVHDSDHIPNGERVMLMKTADELHPSISKVHATFGIPDDQNGVRYGAVRSRYRRSGDYMVMLEGTSLTICVSRGDFVHPVPDNMIALEPGRARQQRRTRP